MIADRIEKISACGVSHPIFKLCMCVCVFVCVCE